ncbi:hypothetical protein RFN25_07385 [Mesorhizobium abyssinicae]|uniref:hypothetical protein n=1 Tax=Mesorhizobium abyssinicae TaxID=1209958 RepID=UPI002A23FD18|nr:hypothetical protein [Mesorhizobium abyssinicae]MDX8433255.1 hypothetical protein [Mesorhizobium abyssinicae]
MNTFAKLRRNIANSVALILWPQSPQVLPVKGGAKRRTLVIGGGPVGLAFATTLHELGGDDMEITIADGRWIFDGRGIRWRKAAEGVNRRQQVVTIQSLVFTRLPVAVRSAIFPPGGYGEIWPNSRESPARLGYPRNIRIHDLEDRLLALAESQHLHLHPEEINAAELSLRDWELVVIADGSNSRTREHFSAAFGQADATPYSLEGRQVVDTVLGLQVRSGMPSASTVILTIAQQRFLFNGLPDGKGMLYMRLTDEEAAEVRGRVPGEREFRPCIQSNPCQVTWRADPSRGAFVCAQRGSEFTPADDPASFLWPRVLEGLKLFGIPRESLDAITTFPLAMTRRGAFSAEITPTGTPQRVFAALIGDAAGVTHFWPGRGLNRGLSSAYALAVVASRVDPAANLRSADFAEFEGIMAQLQSRHQDRAWRAMVQMRAGHVDSTKAIIRQAITGRRADRKVLLREMHIRTANLAAGLKDRLPSSPVLSELFAAYDEVDDETLAVLVATGAWETVGSGGAEVDVDAILRVTKVPGTDDIR